VDVRLSPEQQALRDSVRQVVEHHGPKAVGQLDDDERKGKLDAAVAASGWRELRIAIDDSRQPLASAVEAAVVAEELGRALADASFVGPTLAADLRRLAGIDPAAGVETVALTTDLATLAPATGGSLDAAALAIDASGAGAALAAVPGDGATTLATVAVTADPVLVDLTRPGVVLDPGAAATPVEGGRPIGADDLTRWQALALALACADLVGVMRGAVELSTEYAKGRQQYGVVIGSFQAVQHLLADAFVLMEGSRSAALHAAWAVDALEPAEALAAAAVAKAYSARAARTVCETAIQVHGGIGNTWECLAHVYLRRALLSTDLLGGTGPNLARVLTHHGIGGN